MTALPASRLGALLVAWLLVSAAGPAAASDYEVELANLDRALADADADPARRLQLLDARASLTGDLDDLEQVSQLVDRLLAISETDDLLLQRAAVSLELHRLDAAAAALVRLAQPAHPRARQLGADLARQRGRVDEAQREDEALLARGRTWDRLARVAYGERRRGHERRADRLYAEAQAELSAWEMRRYAWLELQRGLIDLDRRRFDAAVDHFRRADRAYSGHWLVEEHLAEALAATGRTEEAEAIYRRVVASTQHPEYLAALADLIAERDPQAAAALDRQAEERYAERFSRYPEAVAGHFADYLLARDPRDPRALELAELDHRSRPGVDATLRLAKVCLAIGDAARARRLLDQVKASPWRPRNLDRELRQFQADLGARPVAVATHARHQTGG